MTSTSTLTVDSDAFINHQSNTRDTITCADHVSGHVTLQIYLTPAPIQSTSLLTHTPRKMTNLVKTDLFDGAIKADLPKGFIDASYVIGPQSNLGAVPTYLDPA